MFKKICSLILLGSFCVFISGCAVLTTALSMAAAYGIYEATKHK